MKERFKFKLPVKKITIILTVTTLLLVALSVIGSYYFHYLGYENSYSAFYVTLFDLNTEGNLPTLFSTLLLMSASVILFLIFIKRKIAKDQDYMYWLLLGGVFLFLSLDESLQIHEKITRTIDLIGSEGEVKIITERPGFLRYVWVVPYIGLVAALFFVLYKFLWRLPTSTRNLFLVSGFLFVFGAVGLEFFEAYYDAKLGTNYYTVVLYTIEEALEMGGVVMFIYALLSFLAGDRDAARINIKITFKSQETAPDISVKANR